MRVVGFVVGVDALVDGVGEFAVEGCWGFQAFGKVLKGFGWSAGAVTTAKNEYAETAVEGDFVLEMNCVGIGDAGDVGGVHDTAGDGFRIRRGDE